MREKLQDHMEVVARARKAMEACGLTPSHPPIRGGTDGATITYMGMPCPNLPTGGCNFHSVYEYVSSQALKRWWTCWKQSLWGKNPKQKY